MLNQHNHHPTPRLTRRGFLLGASTLLGMTALSACVPIQPAAPAGDAESATAEETHEIVDDNGVSSLIAGTPQRVAAMYDSIDLDACLGLGVDPIAYCSSPTDSRAHLPWKKIPPTTTLVPIGDGPNLESLVALNPDLVISAYGDPEAMERLREYCPVVYLPFGDWRAATRMAGNALFRDEAAEALIDETDALIAATRTKVEGLVSSVNVVSIFGEDYYLDEGGSQLGKLLNEVGVPLAGTEYIVQVSLEVLPEKLTADTLIVLDYSYNFEESQQTQLEKLMAEPVLANVPAIVNGRVLQLTTEETAAGYLMSALSIPTLLTGLERLTTL